MTPLPRLRPRQRRTQRGPVCEATPPSKSYELGPEEIGVRFINTPSGKDVVAAANVGDSLLRVGDSVGVHIPRACQSGLCGSCTCDIVDANSEDGIQTVRACQTGAVIPDDGEELVVDVARMKSFRSQRDPMARFQNMDTEYVARAVPNPPKGTWLQTKDCPACTGVGDAECYTCEGQGEDEGFPCALCAGSGMLRCAHCQGTGTVKIRR